MNNQNKGEEKLPSDPFGDFLKTQGINVVDVTAPKSKKTCEHPAGSGYCIKCLHRHDEPSPTQPDIKKKPAPSGENHPSWKGDKASVDTFHQWLNQKIGKPTYCQNDECPRVSTYFEWCLKRGKKYSRDPESYVWLCRPCHRKYDQTPERLAQLKKNLIWYKKVSAMKPGEFERLKSLKICSKCKERPKVKWSVSYCKECYNERDRARYYRSREKRLEKDRKYYKNKKK